MCGLQFQNTFKSAQNHTLGEEEEEKKHL